MNIGTVIRKLRLAQGATLEALALEIGIDGGNLSRIERAIQQPAFNMVEPIAAALKITPAELIAAACANETNQAQADVDLTLLSNYRSLTPANQQLVLEFVLLLNRLNSESN
ncbi:helix-turn-helix domain-containing protein [Deefgea salmonis]|uniref:Helix-turn-helix domain-containing protein n=1 Tax=Deefgea salmonis TaxID=2875502 RepID=A0ABS8BKE9_9NEIS|nr:helix-turn-helix transcriptional regulator [Deefgea salmonis]MCB5196179.1 helix-turn-helix domain-containing protein [Deefgea salmonis]